MEIKDVMEEPWQMLLIGLKATEFLQNKITLIEEKEVNVNNILHLFKIQDF